MEYEIEDILEGDKVYFELDHQNNYGHYWKVTGKRGNLIMVEIDELGHRGWTTVRLNDILYLERTSPLRA